MHTEYGTEERSDRPRDSGTSRPHHQIKEDTMAVRQGVLALLQSGPKYGYQLKTEFEANTGKIWSLNIGQVYQTLGRLGRDGLVVQEEGHDGQQLYRITDAGRELVREWFSSPVDRATPPRDEVTVKLLLAIRGAGGDVAEVIQVQRNAAIRTLQDYTRLKAKADASSDLAWLMVLDSMILQAEAEVRWLDLVESRIRRSDRGLGEQGERTEGAGEAGDRDERQTVISRHRLGTEARK